MVSSRETQGELDAMRLLAAIVESSDDAIIAKTLDGIITSWNKGAERIYGYTESEAVGRPVAMLVPEDQPDEIPSILSRIRAGEKIEHFLTKRQRKDGSIIDVAVTISPITNDDDVIVGASAIARDITDRRRAVELEAANEALTDFFAMASHDLRTPITVIEGFGETITDAWDSLEDDKKLHYIGIMTRQAAHLASIVSDLAAIASIQTHEVLVQPTTVEVGGFVRRMIEDLGVRGVTVEATIPDGMTVKVDEAHLRRILENFITNAWRYGAPPIVIAARREPDCVVFEVTDGGPGIPPEFVPSLFEKFARVDKVASREKGGTGLGLAIAKGLADANGGTVWYEPNQPRGARFSLRLPTDT